MPSTRTDIFNNALSMYGHTLLSSDEDDTPEARELRSKWDSTVRYCLERGKWNFAEKLSISSPLDNQQTTYGFDNAFNKPPDWAGTNNINECDDRDYELRPEQWRDSGGKIYANALVLYHWYNSDSVKNTPGVFSQSFSDYLSARLAVLTVYRISPSNTVMEGLRGEEQRRLNIAQGFDGRNNPPQRYPSGRIARARRGYYGFATGSGGRYR